jgi:hypothetical protein
MVKKDHKLWVITKQHGAKIVEVLLSLSNKQAV